MSTGEELPQSGTHPLNPGQNPPPVACSVSIGCPPVPPNGSLNLVPNFRTTGTYYCNNAPQLRLIFRLFRGQDVYTAPNLTAPPPGGIWIQTGWNPAPPNGAGYTLVVTLEKSADGNNWQFAAQASVTNIVISPQGTTCQ